MLQTVGVCIYVAYVEVYFMVQYLLTCFLFYLLKGLLNNYYYGKWALLRQNQGHLNCLLIYQLYTISSKYYKAMQGLKKGHLEVCKLSLQRLSADNLKTPRDYVPLSRHLYCLILFNLFYIIYQTHHLCLLLDRILIYDNIKKHNATSFFNYCISHSHKPSLYLDTK